MSWLPLDEDFRRVRASGEAWRSVGESVPTHWNEGDGRQPQCDQPPGQTQHEKSSLSRREAMAREAQDVVDLCKNCGLTVASGESCTGGMIACMLTDVPQAGQMLEQSFITYSQHAKEKLLFVPPALIEKQGVVSAQVAVAMAQGALAQAETDIGIGTTGILGLEDGPDQEPAGHIFIAVATRGGDTEVTELQLGPMLRAHGREQSVLEGLRLLKEMIAKMERNKKKRA